MEVPTLLAARPSEYSEYIQLLCDTLNGWASQEFQVHGTAVSDGNLGVGMVVLEKTRRGAQPGHLNGATKDVLAAIHRLQRGAAKPAG